MADIEVDWVVSCLSKADCFVQTLLVRERENGARRILIESLVQARVDINRAIEDITHFGEDIRC